MFDRICAENGIRHLLTAPRSPTTTGKVERWHKTIRAEFLRVHDRRHAHRGGAAGRAGCLGRGVQHRPAAPGVGDAAPIERFQLAPHIWAGEVPVIDPIPASAQPGVQPAMRLHGVQRWVDRRGVIRLAGFSYRVPIILAGEPVEAVVTDHLVSVFHRDVLVAEHVQRRKPDGEAKEPVQGRRTARQATSGLTVTRVADNSGSISFAGTSDRVGNAWRRRSVQVSIVASSVQLACDGQIVRVHDRSKEHGAFATPNGRPRHRQDAPAGAASRPSRCAVGLPAEP